MSFLVASEIFLDYLNESLNELLKLPVDSHLGQTNYCMLEDMFPPQFLMFYNYEFLYAVKCNVIRLRAMARLDQEIIAHSILDGLTLYLISGSLWTASTWKVCFSLPAEFSCHKDNYVMNCII